MAFADIGLAPAELKAPSKGTARRREKAGLHLGLARDALNEFGRGAHLFGVTKGQFSMIDIAAAVLAKTGPADVAVWTWCIADYEVEAIGAFLTDGAIRSFRLVMDWAGAQRDMPIVEALQARYGEGCIRVTKTHAKIVAIGNESWRVVIRGSMNLNANPRFEQFDVSEGGPAWDVVAGLMDELWERGKPLPARKLKHSDAVALLDVEKAALPPPPSWAGSLSTAWWGNGGQKTETGGT